jgi:hypothetical protein
MTTHKRTLGFSLLSAILLSAAGVLLRADDESINWLGDYREAIRQARQTHRPILVEFRCEA